MPEDAPLREIKKQYKKLALSMHPDKSDAPDAEVKFRSVSSKGNISLKSAHDINN